MKILMCNNSGNVGKSFLSRELFYPNFDVNSRVIIEVETRNSSTTDYKNINVIKTNGSDLSTVFNEMMNYDDYIVDVGASRIEQFFTELDKSAGIDDEDIDLVIIPVTKDPKIQKDSVKTLKMIDKMGLLHKTKIIFNKINNEKSINNFVELIKKNNIDFTVNKELLILEYDALEEIEKTMTTVKDLANSDKNYKELAREAVKDNNVELKEKYIDLYTYQRYAIGISKNLDKVYALLLATM